MHDPKHEQITNSITWTAAILAGVVFLIYDVIECAQCSLEDHAGAAIIAAFLGAIAGFTASSAAIAWLEKGEETNVFKRVFAPLSVILGSLILFDFLLAGGNFIASPALSLLLNGSLEGTVYECAIIPTSTGDVTIGSMCDE